MNNKGFTLIELLVVVLIIGILAAMALPQYMKAVEKSRASEAVQLVGQLINAEKIYEMATGGFTNDLNALDIEMPSISNTSSARGSNFIIAVTNLDNGATGTSPRLTITATRVNSSGATFSGNVDQNYTIGAQILADGTETRYCNAGSNTKPQAVCKSISNGATMDSSKNFVLK